MCRFIFSWPFTASPSSTPSAARCWFHTKYLQFRRCLRNRLRSFEVWFRSDAKKSFLSFIPFIPWAHNWNRRHGMFYQKDTRRNNTKIPCLYLFNTFYFLLQQKRIINDEKDIENLGDGIDAKEKIEKILEKLAKVIEIMRIRIKSM